MIKIKNEVELNSIIIKYKVATMTPHKLPHTTPEMLENLSLDSVQLSPHLPNIAMLADFDTTKRPRPHRMLQALKPIANVFVIARETSQEDGVHCFSFKAPPHNAQTRTKEQNDRIQKLCENREFAELIYTQERAIIPSILSALPPLALIIVEDIVLLPFACDYKRKNGCKILVDLREFYPLEYEDSAWLCGIGRLFAYVCEEFLPQADSYLCVSEPIAKRYERDFRIQSELYYSLPPFHSLAPAKTHKPMRLLYHGLISSERGSLNLLELARILSDDYELYCRVLSNNTDFLDRFIAESKNIDRLHILPPVPLEEIVASSNAFDIGIISLQPTSFNNSNAMPNKFFEYIQSRLCVVSTPLPAISAFLEHYEVGLVARDCSVRALADTIMSLSTEQICAYKANAHAYAYELSLETNAKKARNIIQKLVR